MDSDSSAPLSRRAWTLLLAAAPLCAQVSSQTSPPPLSAAPDQKLSEAKAEIRKVSERLSQSEVAMDVEPSFVFRV